MIDPNSTIASAFEVRVTLRGVRVTEHGAPTQVSTRSDFIAPDMAPVSTLAIELDKGMRGWSDHSVKIDVARDAHREAVAKRQLAQLTVGTRVIRKAPDTGMRVAHRTGPRSGR